MCTRITLILMLCLMLRPAPLLAETQGQVAHHAKATLPAHHTPKLSFHFKAIPVREVLSLLARLNHSNLIISDAVSGTLTLHLDQVTWQEAFDTILSIEGLGVRRKGKILFIAPAADILTHTNHEVITAPLQTVFIPVHYATASGVSTLLHNKSSHLLSDRGSITADDRTNQIWIKDTPQHIRQVQRFLRGVDKPAKQVQISAYILSVNEESVKELGLRFGTVLKSEQNGDSLQRDMPLTADNVGRFSVAIAKLGQGTLLNLQLSALERAGRAKILSSPQLVTSNRQAASIESGQEIPYQESTSSGATSTDFKKAALSLKVTPDINPDNKILLNIVVNQDKVDTLTVNGVPAISTQAIQSKVLVNNGETVVLGGIYAQSSSRVKERLPFLHAIPIVGKLFMHKESDSSRQELLIFVTPRVL